MDVTFQFVVLLGLLRLQKNSISIRTTILSYLWPYLMQSIALFGEGVAIQAIHMTL